MHECSSGVILDWVMPSERSVGNALWPLSANFTKWSNTLEQFVGKLPTNFLSVFDHVVGMALKGLTTKIFIDFNDSTSGHSSYIECTYDDDMTSRSSHRSCTIKKVFLKILQNSQENSSVRVSILIKLEASGRAPLFTEYVRANMSGHLGHHINFSHTFKLRLLS